jgi:type II secretory pathway component PulF
MRIDLEAISRFAFSMATCLSSGLRPSQSLELSGTTAQSTRLLRAATAAAEGCENGLPISDGFEPYAGSCPRFFIPVIRAEEMGGRQVEAFRLIHEHCQRLKPALTALRNTWLYPVVCVLAGWIIQTCIFLYFGMFSFAWQFVRDTFITSAGVVLVGWGLMQTRPVKEMVESLLLHLPLVRETLVRLAIVLFFSTFRLAYEAGGLNVLTVFDLALATVPNAAIRRDLTRARPVLAEAGAFEEAFAEPRLLEDSLKSSIAAGAMSGHLGSSLEQITKSETLELEILLQKFNSIFQRLVAFGVVMSVVGTVLMCMAYSPGK